jgi:uncharacterized coiled-coil protein SlyX
MDGPSAPEDGTYAHQAGRPSAPLPSGEDALVEVLASVLTRPDVIDTLAAAVTRRQDEEAQHRAEIEALTAELETTDFVTAAAAAVTDPKGQS